MYYSNYSVDAYAAGLRTITMANGYQDDHDIATLSAELQGLLTVLHTALLDPIQRRSGQVNYVARDVNNVCQRLRDAINNARQANSEPELAPSTPRNQMHFPLTTAPALAPRP